MAEFIVTIFQNAKSPDKPFHVPVTKIIDRIKNGSSQFQVAKIQSCVDTKSKTELKTQLPSICFSGKFSYRKNEALIKHSGLVAIDFDHLGDKYDDFRSRIINDQYTFIAFRSPSGDGMKVVVKIPPSINTHRRSCNALTEYYREDKLDEFKDVARVCFESYDPDIFYNPDSRVFDTMKEDEVIKNQIPEGEQIFDFNVIYDYLKNWLKKNNELYTDGNKHKYLVKLSSACLRFNISENYCSQKLIFEFSNHEGCGAVIPSDIDNIVRSVYKNYLHTAGTAHLTVQGEGKLNTNDDIQLSDFDISLPLKDVIYLDAVREDMLKNFKSGLNIGETTHFKNSIDNHFRMKRGELNLFHGIGNHGKSTMLMQLLLVKSVKDDYKWAVFSPEQNPPSDFYDDLVHMFIGKNTLPTYKEQMTEEEFKRGMDFIKDHFFYIYPENDSPTPEFINTRFLELIKKHKVDGCVIDPYNQLDNDITKSGGREDQYLSSFLTKQKRFAQINDVFMFIVAHPKGGMQKGSDGNYIMPDVYDLAGGGMWNNKIDNIICIHRPYASTDKANNTCYFESQKIKKRKLCGDPGRVVCNFDISSMRYLAVGKKVFTNSSGIETGCSEVEENPLNEVTQEESERLISNLNFYEPIKETEIEFNIPTEF